MQIDSTPHTVYVHDLDAELADEFSSDEDTPVFIPDIEKHLAKIPPSVLRAGVKAQGERDDGEGNGKGQELVLYKLPESISVAPEKDSVRRAILESRARAKEEDAEGNLGFRRRVVGTTETVSMPSAAADDIYQSGVADDMEEDVDMMDIE